MATRTTAKQQLLASAKAFASIAKTLRAIDPASLTSLERRRVDAAGAKAQELSDQLSQAGSARELASRAMRAAPPPQITRSVEEADRAADVLRAIDRTSLDAQSSKNVDAFEKRARDVRRRVATAVNR